MSIDISGIPPAIMPEYRTPGPNEGILMYDGPIETVVGVNHLLSEAKVQLLWSPHPRLHFETSLHGVDPPLGTLSGEEVSIHLKEVGMDAQALCISLTIPSMHARFILRGPALFGAGARCTELVFYVSNFHEFIGKPVRYGETTAARGRLEFPADHWRITLDETDDCGDLVKRLEREGGIALTHVGKVCLEDRGCFVAEDGENVLEAFRWFLCLCRGLFVGIPIVTGRDGTGKRTYECWTSSRASPWVGANSWFPDLSSTMVEPLFQEFRALWQDGFWRDILTRAIHWYIVANLNEAAVEGSVVLAQIALERLAWANLVETDKALSNDGFSRLRAADQLRLFLNRSGVPVELPNALPKLWKYGNGLDVKDVPEAVVSVRNAVVHPSKKRIQSHVVREAREASLWCLELAILKLLGYQCLYRNRVEGGEREVSVPWAANQ